MTGAFALLAAASAFAGPTLDPWHLPRLPDRVLRDVGRLALFGSGVDGAVELVVG
jgi:hypothetical protein